MAFAVKYRMDWTDQFGSTDAFRLDFELEGYVGGIIGLGHEVDDSFEHNYNEGTGWVVGSEGIGSFHVNQTDIAAYDADFYDSAFQDIKVKFYINSNLDWVGWLKPENTTREFLNVGADVQYRVSATDGLNDLKSIDYTGHQFLSGRQSFLQVIKNAISFNNITDLDFFIQSNMYEDVLMVEGENAFVRMTIENLNFYRVKDGINTPDKCFDVLEKCVTPFYCQLYQADGFWKIVNGQEYTTQSDTYNYTTLDLTPTGTDVTFDRTVDITNFNRPAEDTFELSKESPLKI